MTVCRQCSTQLPEGARFCDECGAAQQAGCTSCGAELRAGARFCMRCGAAQQASPAAGETTAGVSARRMTSVLFGDLVGFTSLSESRDQEEVREILSAYFEECRVIIDRYGGTVEKFIGDAVMAVWGVPVTHEDDAERAVRAGLELVDAVAALGDRVGVEGLAMRVGIVTGEVAVTVGARGQGMVAGDPVNTAARVESVAAPGQVWVDETTRLLAQAAVSFTDVGSHRLKGKEHPVPLWAAQAVVAGIGGEQRADGLEAPLVGRDRELRLVKEIFHGTQETRLPGLLLVPAGPGLGKTRLGWEFSKYIDGLTDGVRWLEGRCPAYGDGAPFHALADALRGRLRALDATGEAALGDQLDTFLETHVADPGERPRLRSRLAALLGLPGAQVHSREELFAAWLTTLQHMSVGMTAVVLLIDDAQYADDGLLDFIEFTLSAKELPLLVVLLARPELLIERPSLISNPRTVTTHLQELAPADMTRLISSLVAGLPDAVTAALVDRAAGVPLFAVETVRSLIDQGVVVRHEGTYILEDRGWDIGELAAPVSLQALIASRLDALPDTLREVVDLASVLGSSFKSDLLARLVGSGPIEERLSALVQRQMLVVDANPLSAEYGAYSFAQDILRQVAYSMLARRDRHTAHLRVVDLFDETASDTDLPVIAHHLAAAADTLPGVDGIEALRERAIEALEAAGAWAMKLGSWGDADAMLHRALDLTDVAERRARLLCQVAEVHSFGADPDRGVAAGREALELARSTDNAVLEGKAAGVTGYLLYTVGALGEAISLIEPYWEAFRDRTDADDALRWIARATGAVRAESGGDTRGPDEVLLAISERSGEPTDLLRGLNAVAGQWAARQLSGAARILYSGALQFAREHDQRRMEAILLTNIGSLELSVDLKAGAATTRDALAVIRELHWLQGQRIGVFNLSTALYSLGRWQEREALLEGEAPEITESPGPTNPAIDSVWIALARGETPAPFSIPDLPDHPVVRISARLANAAITTARPHLTPAERDGLIEELLAITLDVPLDPVFHADFADWLFAIGQLLVALGEGDILAQVLARHATLPDAVLPPSALGARAKTQAEVRLLRDGPSTEVVDGLRAAIAVFEAWGGVVHTRRTQHKLAEVLDALGENEEAAALRIPVRAFYEEVGATAWLAQLDPETAIRT